MISAEQTVLLAMLLCFSGAAVTWRLRRRALLAGWVAFGVVLTSSLAVGVGAAQVLLTGAGHAVTFLAVPSLGFALRIYVDGLSAVFLGLIATVTVPAAFYSIEYMRHPAQPDGVGRYYPNLLLFIAAMYGLVSTTDMMWFFFIFWQMMTWAGWALIRFERGQPKHARAANKYLWMMQLACAVTMVGAGMLAGTEVQTATGETLLRHDFDAVMHHLPVLLATRGGWVAVAFALFLIGFGIKLGVWPFGQIWLPDAHPAAPSPVSALLSGVMIKTGVYGLMRYFLWLVPAEAQALYPAGAWGTVLLLLGTVTLFTGTVQALHQDTSKRLLAYSSIGQAGYILLGLGTCLLLLPAREPALAALASVAFGGALFHTVNHGIFKSLLFLNAGSVLHATGTQDLNKLGGLMRFMPLTAVTAMVATFAIAGVPLFSGFASKWSMYVAAIQGHGVSAWLPVCTIVAMLTSAITLALFLKFFGSMFLSRTSTLVATRATRPGRLEVNWQMRAAQLVLAGICLVFGLVPALGTGLVRHALHASRQGLGEVLAGNLAVTAGAWTGLAGTTGAALYAPLGVGLVLALLFVLVRALARLGGAARRPAVPWLCGYAQEADLHRYRASGLYGELKRGWCRINVLASLWAAGRKGFAGPRAQPVVPPTPAPPQPVEITS